MAQEPEAAELQSWPDRSSQNQRLEELGLELRPGWEQVQEEAQPEPWVRAPQLAQEARALYCIHRAKPSWSIRSTACRHGRR